MNAASMDETYGTYVDDDTDHSGDDTDDDTNGDTDDDADDGGRGNLYTIKAQGSRLKVRPRSKLKVQGARIKDQRSDQGSRTKDLVWP